MDALGLLRPAASISGLPAAHVPHAASGFALGDHAGRAPAAPADGPGVVASASSGPLQRRFEPYQNNGGYVVGHVRLWGWSLCGRGTCRSGWALWAPFQHRRCEGALLASFCAVMLRGGTLQAVLGQPSAGVAGERIRGAWLYCTCAGSRIDQQ